MDQQLATLVRDARGLDYRVKGWLNLIAHRGGTLYANTQTNMADLGIKSKNGYYNWRKAALGSGLMVEQRRYDASTVYVADVDLLRAFLPESSNEETMSGSDGDVWALAEQLQSPQMRKLCPDKSQGDERGSESSNEETEDTITPIGITPMLSRPSALQSDEEALDTETPSGPQPEEPVSDEGLAAEVVETLPCGCAAGTSCPECRGDMVKHSNLTPAKQKELDERWKVAEGIDPNTGTPVDRDRLSTGYQSRRRH